MPCVGVHRPGECIRSPRAGVNSNCESPDVVLGTELGTSATGRSILVLNHLTSPYNVLLENPLRAGKMAFLLRALGCGSQFTHGSVKQSITSISGDLASDLHRHQAYIHTCRQNILTHKIIKSLCHLVVTDTYL